MATNTCRRMLADEELGGGGVKLYLHTFDCTSIRSLGNSYGFRVQIINTNPDKTYEDVGEYLVNIINTYRYISCFGIVGVNNTENARMKIIARVQKGSSELNKLQFYDEDGGLIIEPTGGNWVSWDEYITEVE